MTPKKKHLTSINSNVCIESERSLTIVEYSINTHEHFQTIVFVGVVIIVLIEERKMFF
jgi:hypothetical protein